MKHRYWIISLLVLCLAGALWAGVGEKAQVREYRAVAETVFHHDPSAYTQGLFLLDGVLYESVGQYGESAIRQLDLASGRVVLNKSMEPQFFGEGACFYGGHIYQLTWRENVCFVYDRALNLVGQMYVPSEGWGLTTDGTSLILSDGTSTLYFMDPMTFEAQREVTVTKAGKKVPYLNELEYIDGKVWANVYGTDYVVIIDPQDGHVEATVDCAGLLPSRYAGAVDVLNGIAYDRQSDKVYLTGKLWPELYEISLVEKAQ